jgi:hypothetical protein
LRPSRTVKKPQPAQAQGIAPLERYDSTSLVDRLHNADHLGGRELTLEHGADRLAPLDQHLRHLMVHGIRVIELGQAGCIGAVESLHPAFDRFARRYLA